jgi:protein-S-isoprenylcysteine O-methyltransferase Ste14
MSAVPRDSALTEWLLRGFALLLLGWFIGNVARVWWTDTSRYTLLLLVLAESFTLLLVLFARRALVRDMSPMAVIATVYACLCFVLFSLGDTQRLAPEWLGATFQTVGMVWVLVAKVKLGRCFGLLPATRGLITDGPYRVVRHPIYLGYLISHVGFLLASFSLQNVAVLVVLYLAQDVRMRREESVLEIGGQRVAYRDYRTSVRYRIVPLVY